MHTVNNAGSSGEHANSTNLLQSQSGDTVQQFLKAIHHGEQEQIKSLLEAQPSLANSVDDEKGLSAFELALDGGLSSIAQRLIAAPGFDVNHEGHHPLRIAIDLGYLDLAKQLLEAGSNPNYRPAEISSALLLCLEKEYYALAKKMVAHGAEVDIRNNKGWTPLIWASIKGRKATVEFLLGHNANVHLCNNDGWNAITGAYFKKHLDIVDLLKEAGAVFGANYSEAAMLSAYENGHHKIVEMLLEQGANPDVGDEEGNSLPIKAAKNGHYELLSKLIDKGCDVNCCNSSKTPLIVILSYGENPGIIKQILEAGADINLATEDGTTALHYAAFFNHISTVELLTSKGANLNAKATDSELTPLMIAGQRGYKRVVEILVTAGASMQQRDKENQTAKGSTLKCAPRDKNKRLVPGVFTEILELLTLPGHSIDAA